MNHQKLMKKNSIHLIVASYFLASCSTLHEQKLTDANSKPIINTEPVKVSIEQKQDLKTGDSYFAYCSGDNCAEPTKKIIVASNSTTAISYNNEPAEIQKNAEIKSLKSADEPKPFLLHLDRELKSIPFDANQTQLSSKGIEMIHELIPRAFKADKIYIRGRTDASGEKSKNIILAKKRAAEVSQVMINAGVDNTKITQTYCTECFITDNDSAENRAINRRVDIELKFK